MANILVTGGGGNIGMYAVAEFIHRGHDVVVFDQNPPSSIFKEIAPCARMVQGDILDPAMISEAVSTNKIDYILHLAAFLTLDSLVDPVKAMQVNCQGTANIFDAAMQHGVKRVCWSSSAAAIGTMPDYDGRLVDESYRVAATTPYGASKYYCELMSGIYRSKGLDVKCVRPVFAFGLGKLTGSWGANYNRIIYNAATGRPSIFPSWSKNGQQIVYNKDQAKFCVDVTLDHHAPSWLFNTPAEKVFSEDDFIALIKSVVPDAVIVRDPQTSVGSGSPPNVDGSRASAELGFIPGYGVTAGITEMVEYYRRHPEQGL